MDNKHVTLYCQVQVAPGIGQFSKVESYSGNGGSVLDKASTAGFHAERWVYIDRCYNTVLSVPISNRGHAKREYECRKARLEASK